MFRTEPSRRMSPWAGAAPDFGPSLRASRGRTKMTRSNSTDFAIARWVIPSRQLLGGPRTSQSRFNPGVGDSPTMTRAVQLWDSRARRLVLPVTRWIRIVAGGHRVRIANPSTAVVDADFSAALVSHDLLCEVDCFLLGSPNPARPLGARSLHCPSLAVLHYMSVRHYALRVVWSLDRIRRSIACSPVGRGPYKRRISHTSVTQYLLWEQDCVPAGVGSTARPPGPRVTRSGRDR